MGSFLIGYMEVRHSLLYYVLLLLYIAICLQLKSFTRFVDYYVTAKLFWQNIILLMLVKTNNRESLNVKIRTVRLTHITTLAVPVHCSVLSFGPDNTIPCDLSFPFTIKQYGYCDIFPAVFCELGYVYTLYCSNDL